MEGFERFAMRAGSVLLAVVIASACAGGPDAPQWVRGKPTGFPRDHYSWGVGSGPDAGRAASAAIDALEDETDGESEGATIERKWLDDERQIHWALAVLDRTKAIERLRGALATTEQQLAVALAADASDVPPARRLGGVVRAVELARVRTVIARRIGRLGGEVEPVADPAREPDALAERLAALKHETAIDVEAFEMDARTGTPGEPLDALRTALTQAVLARGFRVDSPSDWSPSSAWLLVRARVGFERLELGDADRFVSVAWNAAVEVHDRTGAGELLAVLSSRARATHVSESEALREARQQAEAFATEAFAGWLDERTKPRS